MSPPGMLGDEGRQVLGGQERELFPLSVRPAFLRLLWIALALLAVAAGLLVSAATGMLS